MKKHSFLFAVILIAFLMPVAVTQAAGPYLTCDPYEISGGAGSYPTEFRLVFDTGSEVSSPSVASWGPASATQVTMKHDLSTLADGNHTVKGKAVSVGDGVVVAESDYSELWTFSKGKPANPALGYLKEGTPLKYFLISQVYPTSAIGGPPTTFNMSLDNGPTVAVPAIITAEGNRFKYEITNVATGSHVITVIAVNDWGPSATAAFTFQRYVVIYPKSIRILK